MMLTCTLWQFLLGAALLIGGICAIGYSFGVRAERVRRDRHAPPVMVAEVSRMLHAAWPHGPLVLQSYEIEYAHDTGLRVFVEASASRAPLERS